MILYTNTLTLGDLRAALPPDIELLGTEHGGKHDVTLVEGPRSRKFMHVRLCSWTRRGPGKNYVLTTGGHGSWSLHAYNATWDEHGIWMTRLFDLDPNLKITGANVYDGRSDFHHQTDYKFEQYRKPLCADLTCEDCYPNTARTLVTA